MAAKFRWTWNILKYYNLPSINGGYRVNNKIEIVTIFDIILCCLVITLYGLILFWGYHLLRYTDGRNEYLDKQVTTYLSFHLGLLNPISMRSSTSNYEGWNQKESLLKGFETAPSSLNYFLGHKCFSCLWFCFVVEGIKLESFRNLHRACPTAISYDFDQWQGDPSIGYPNWGSV